MFTAEALRTGSIFLIWFWHYEIFIKTPRKKYLNSRMKWKKPSLLPVVGSGFLLVMVLGSSVCCVCASMASSSSLWNWFRKRGMPPDTQNSRNSVVGFFSATHSLPRTMWLCGLWALNIFFDGNVDSLNRFLFPSGTLRFRNSILCIGVFIDRVPDS